MGAGVPPAKPVDCKRRVPGLRPGGDAPAEPLQAAGAARPVTMQAMPRGSLPRRRELLARGASLAATLVGAGLLPTPARADWQTAAFEARTLAELSRALGLPAPVESKEVRLEGPEISENGAVVPVVASTTLPSAKRLMVLIEKNPAPLAAVFELSDGVEPSLSLRIKMAESCNVYAVAVTADNRVAYAVRDIKVTLGGCGG